MSPLVRSEPLGLIVNPLTVDAMYSCHNRWNLPQLIQMNLFYKRKTISRNFITYLEST